MHKLLSRVLAHLNRYNVIIKRLHTTLSLVIKWGSVCSLGTLLNYNDDADGAVEKQS